MKTVDPLTRFSSRAAWYQNRPAYPAALLDYLVSACELKKDQGIADIGSGTGYLTRVFLENGNRVFAVEPNDSMREVAEGNFGSNPLFTSFKGTAESIPLCDHSVDVVAVGQALHWFEIDKARIEFLRVLRSGGWIVVVDVRACDDGNELMQACAAHRKRYFEDIGTAADPPVRIVRLFAGLNYKKHSLPTQFACSERVFCEGNLSSSLAPEFGSMAYEDARRALQKIFRTYQENGQIELTFETIVWSARVTDAAGG